MKFLVTAGPTREPIDPVRYISNRSSGKMGYAIAQALLDAGNEVTLVSGPTALESPIGAKKIAVTTSGEMFDAVQKFIGRADALIMCAAVSDFKPARYRAQKIKRKKLPRRLEIVPAVDILRSVRLPKKNNFLVVGFAAETENLARNAKKKLREKRCDIIVANDVSLMNAGFESDYNAVTLYFKSGDVRKFGRNPKTKLARSLAKIFMTPKKNIDAMRVVDYESSRSNVDHKNFQPSATADRKGGLLMAKKKKAPKKLAAKKKPAKKAAKKTAKKKR